MVTFGLASGNEKDVFSYSLTKKDIALRRIGDKWSSSTFFYTVKDKRNIIQAYMDDYSLRGFVEVNGIRYAIIDVQYRIYNHASVAGETGPNGVTV